MKASTSLKLPGNSINDPDNEDINEKVIFFKKYFK